MIWCGRRARSACRARLRAGAALAEAQRALRSREEGTPGHHLGNATPRGRMDPGGIRQGLSGYRGSVSRRQRYRRKGDRRSARRSTPGRRLSALAYRHAAGGAARSARAAGLVAVRHRLPQHRVRRQDGLHQQHRLHDRLQQQAGEGSRCSQELDRHARRALQGKGRIQLVPAAAADRGLGSCSGARRRRCNSRATS